MNLWPSHFKKHYKNNLNINLYRYFCNFNSDHFVDRHIGPRQHEKKEMLSFLGFQNIGQLIDSVIPKNIKLTSKLQLDKEISENHLIKRIDQLSNQNNFRFKSYIGMGYYNCITPYPIMRNIFENPGWITQYTAYQAEISQGRLESLLNFQTMICDLTSMDVSNSSLLDEATAAAEAMIMCFRYHRTRRKKFLISNKCHPQTIAVVQTRASSFGIFLEHFDYKLPCSLSEYCGILIQNPDTEGLVQDLSDLTLKCQTDNCLLVVATDLLACVFYKAPGEYGSNCNIVVGSSQRFGIPLNYGGPHAAFLACRRNLVRLMPGRIVGISKDSQNEPALRFALQTREQHIKRDKATSNICTAQALLANMSAMYAIYHGPLGLIKIAQEINRKTQFLAQKIVANSSNSVVHKSFFDTLKVRVNDFEEIKARAAQRFIHLRYYPDGLHVGISLDETTTNQDIDDLLWIFKSDFKSQSEHKVSTSVSSSFLFRTSKILNHPVFNTYHSETRLVRYLKMLENKDLSLVHSMIPLGSCTMKLNGTTELLASSLPHFNSLHPFIPMDHAKGYHDLIQELKRDLCEITGYDDFSFQPNSGAQGEYAGLRVIKAYLDSLGEGHRNICFIPNSAHGTNPASAVMAGFKIEYLGTTNEGKIDIDHLKEKIEKHAHNLACLMITYPSTFGIFDENIVEICDLIHHCKPAQVYLDGANMNAQVGLCRPGDYGGDVSHLNLHKTFCIPHGGGGPGMGPIGVKKHLSPFLPSHPVFTDINPKQSFGSVSSANWGSAAILPVSWAYIKLMGPAGLKHASEIAILNANYMAKRLEKDYKILYQSKNGYISHEFILDVRKFSKTANVKAIDIAKRLQDYGFHAPTVSWPVSETFMIEPTESEDKKSLDQYCDALIMIRKEIDEIENGVYDQKINLLKLAPHTLKVVCSSKWDRPYSREKAAFPADFVRPETKIWPTSSRIDDVYGDQNFVFTLPSVTN